ncbi:MAG: histidine kinase [Nannocystaceae bacterium]|nr:histidine kinase [Nannocystaceae bacterium]
MFRRDGSAIGWLLRPWRARQRGLARAGRVSLVAASLALSILPAMMLYYGIDDWWWDGTLAVTSMAWLGVLVFDELAERIAGLRARAIVGLPRVGFLVAGLFVGITLGYVVLYHFGWSPGRSVATVTRDWWRTMGILVPVIGLTVVVGASLWYRAEAFRLQGAAATASFAVLTRQMQPHLLFNALSALKELTLDDPGRAGALAQRLADLYRLILQAAAEPTITLGRELAIVDNYLGVEQVRFEDRLAFALDVPAALHEIAIPSLMLQTLVENAVRHGIAKSRSGGRIDVRGHEQSGTLVLEVHNTGAPLVPPPAPAPAEDADAPTPRGGVANTRARLALMFGEQARLSIGSDTDGTCVRIELPTGARA